MIASVQTTTSEETLQEVQSQAYAMLRQQLKRFGWSTIPPKNDPDGQAFWNDPTAIEAARAYRRAYRKLDHFRHLERDLKNARAWAENNPDKVREISTNWHESHKEEAIARAALWRRDNPDRFAEDNVNWRKANPDKVREAWHRRRARLANADGNYTEEDFRTLCTEYNNECSYCNCIEKEVGPLVPDHMTPLSRGGDNSIENITPACRHCNSSKGNKTVEEFLDRLEKEATYEKARTG